MARTRAPLTLTPAPAPAAPPDQRYDRVGKTTVIAWVPHAAKTRLRLDAVAQGVSLEEILREAINEYFVKRGHPPIA